ncbi:MAG: DUF4160 domain-containing protein [Methylacidiphilales bacterium]|nr:DUF4160 domain-containing protein [Candidatus Methylacidiphilales bacterium]
MPTVLREQGFQFYFYSHETMEPPHVHVDKGGSSCKYWISPVALARNHGFSEVELNRIRDIILNKQDFLLSKWHEYFNRRN